MKKHVFLLLFLSSPIFSMGSEKGALQAVLASEKFEKANICGDTPLSSESRRTGAKSFEVIVKYVKERHVRGPYSTPCDVHAKVLVYPRILSKADSKVRYEVTDIEIFEHNSLEKRHRVE